MAIVGEVAMFAFGRRDERDESVQELRKAGWLACEGQSIAQNGPTGLNKLFNRIKFSWGSKDTKNVFNLPDLRGRFVRGWDNGSGVDKGMADRRFQAGSDAKEGQVGSEQPESIASHRHGNGWEVPVGMLTPSPDKCIASRGATDRRGGDDGMTGKTETRPVNVNLLYCIYAGEAIPSGVSFFG